VNSPFQWNEKCHHFERSDLRNFLSCIACLFLAIGSSRAASVDYERQVKPILARHCFACHGALRQQSGLRLDAVQFIRKGGDRGPAIEPGKSGQSVLIDAVQGSGDVDKMPPEEQGTPLSEQQIVVLRNWIDQGADAPNEPVPPDPRIHWAYQRPVRTQVPDFRDSLRPRNPIDAFLATRHERNGLVAAPPASRVVLLRRVYLDLVGLPPTREELHEFLSDSAMNAYETVVDRLLSSPRYGERWGRHWMDVWRYTDWSGLENKMRHSQKHIWRWRDWIVESLNQDKGYDRMVMEMLAGDELDPANLKTVRATGFLARNWYLYNRNFWLDDIIEHTSKGFLGITLNCARCHEHKYDPISHEDYYRFRALFEPHNVRLDQIGMQTDLEKDGLPRVYDANPQATTYRFIRGEETRPDKDHPLPPDIPAVLGTIEGTVRPVALPVEAYFPALRPDVRQAAIEQADNAVNVASQELAQKQNDVAAVLRQLGGFSGQTHRKTNGERRSVNSNESRTPAELAFAQAKRELAAMQKKVTVAQAERRALQAVLASDLSQFFDVSDSEADYEKLAQRAVHAKHHAAKLCAELDLMLAENALAAVQKAWDTDSQAAQQMVTDAQEKVSAKAEKLKTLNSQLHQPPTKFPHVGVLYPSTSTGRRLALARWIADEKNPLTARVAVNHIWTRHFGRPLVDSMFDFGLRTKRPVHHRLLDWLSLEFMEHSWSMKQLHRLIVTSSAYRMQSMSSGTAPANSRIDSENLLLWRFNARRMEAELVRDTVIHLSGRLDSTMGGPDLPVTDGDEGTRRTIYYRYSRDHQIKFLTMFDPASVEECYRRRHSIVPQQALAMSNSKMVLMRGRQLAGLITAEVGSENSADTAQAFIDSVFERVLGRSATPAERAACATALGEFTAVSANKGISLSAVHQRARENLVHVLLNHNDFITVW